MRYGTPLSEAYAQGSFVRRLLELPQVAGALHSLVGPEPWVDHHFVHTREPNGATRSRCTGMPSSTSGRTPSMCS